MGRLRSATSNLREPITWLLHGAMLTVFVVLVRRLAGATVGPAAVRRWQMRALIGLAVALAAAAGTARIASGAVWASPLSDVVWGVDAVMLLETIVALLLAIALETPGCEGGVWPELIGRLRGGNAPASSKPICVLGLHFIDEWEARRHARTTTERQDHLRGGHERRPAAPTSDDRDRRLCAGVMNPTTALLPSRRPRSTDPAKEEVSCPRTPTCRSQTPR